MVTTPEINLDALKGQLQGLKTRADALTTKKESLIREAAAQEQRQAQALKELGELGYPEASGLDLQGLADMATSLTTELTTALDALGKAVGDTEALLGVANNVASDLD